MWRKNHPPVADGARWHFVTRLETQCPITRYRTGADQRFHTPIAEPRYNLEGWYAS
jgi:hypothetical protein